MPRSIEAGQVIERLGAVRALVERRQCLGQKSALVPQLPQTAGLLKAGIPRLLVPAAHLGPLGVGLRRLRHSPGITVRLRQQPAALALRFLVESRRSQADFAKLG
jgi:hypothetical protein